MRFGGDPSYASAIKKTKRLTSFKFCTFMGHTIQDSTTLLSLCREICFLARHLHFKKNKHSIQLTIKHQKQGKETFSNDIMAVKGLINAKFDQAGYFYPRAGFGKPAHNRHSNLEEL